MAYADPNDERARKSRRDWYYRNKAKQAAYKKQRDAELAKWLREQKVACERCGEDDPVVLHFHHRDPSQKEIDLGRAVTNGWSIVRMKTEIVKCDVLCANCHLKFHWG